MLAPAGFVCGICVRTYIVDLCVAMAGRAKTYQSTKCYIIFGSYLTYVTTKTTFRVCCGADKERKSISMFSLLWFALFTVHTTAPCNQFFANVRSQFTLTRRAYTHMAMAPCHRFSPLRTIHAKLNLWIVHVRISNSHWNGNVNGRRAGWRVKWRKKERKKKNSTHTYWLICVFNTPNIH